MTAPVCHLLPYAGLLEKLLAAVRPQFRADLYVIDPDDPVLGRGTCAVDGCDRSRARLGLCSAHGARRHARGTPPLLEFLADPGPALNGRRELTTCTVPDCFYGSSGHGLCLRHRDQWEAAGQPERHAWAAAAPPVGRRPVRECLLPFCGVWTENDRQQFCKAHATPWRQLGCPDVDDYLAHCELRGKEGIDFSGLPAQLKLELQYAVQTRRDLATITPSHCPGRWRSGWSLRRCAHRCTRCWT